MECYIVGGWVRDTLLGIAPADVDYVVVATDLQGVVETAASYGTVVHVHEKYGCVRVRMPDRSTADFVLARRDGKYSDQRRPDEVMPGTLDQDLCRRDFTVNAIAYDPRTRTYIDPLGGITDAQTRTLRCPGNARDRLNEDPLRALRAIRFMVTHDLAPDDDLHAALATIEVRGVSADRARLELVKCLRHDTPTTFATLLKYPRVLDGVLKLVQFDAKVT